MTTGLMYEYYHNKFAQDLGVFISESTTPYFGHHWISGCKKILKIPTGQRAEFVTCLYFTVLVDQAVYTHYRHLYGKFENITKYPKFCHGLGQSQHNPRQILDTPFDQGLITESEYDAVLSDGMRLFVEEVIDFCTKHMPEIEPSEFFEKLQHDRDVAMPLMLGMIDPSIEKYPAWKAYRSLADSIKAKFDK